MSKTMKLPNLKGEDVLITGGLGFVGSNLAQLCCELGARVTIYDCLEPRSGGNRENIREIADDVNVLLNDTRNFDGLCKAVKKKSLIFNCAAHTSHPMSMREPWLDLEVNGAGTINLLEAVRHYNAGAKIVHVGTTTQIGRMKTSPVTEDHSEFPMDIYSANKTVAEKYVMIYSNVYKIPATSIRLPNVYGPRSNIRSSEFGFINYFMGLALQGKNLTVYGSGQQLRNIVYVKDAANALVMAAINNRANGDVFFASGDHQVKIIDIAKSIVTNFRSGKVQKVRWPKHRKAIEIGDAVISNAKIKHRLGWKPVWSLDDGLAETQRFLSSRRAAYI